MKRPITTIVAVLLVTGCATHQPCPRADTLIMDEGCRILLEKGFFDDPENDMENDKGAVEKFNESLQELLDELNEKDGT